MANVLFKRGLAANLPTVPEDGTFYLTTDTNKLYVANESKKLVELSQSIISVTSLPAATSAQIGTFYYVTSDNILAISNGSAWTQINPDTNTVLDNVSTGVSTKGNNHIKVQNTYTSSGGSQPNYADAYFEIASKDNTVEITQDGKKINLAVANIDNQIGTLKLDVGGEDGAVDIGLKYGDTELGTAVTLVKGNNVTIKPNTDDKTITFNATDITNAALSFDTSGYLKLGLTKDNGGSPLSTQVKPQIKLGTNSTIYAFNSGTINLPVYTKEEVDTAIIAKLQANNAMVFKGTVNVNNNLEVELPTIEDNISIGYTYIVGGQGYYNDIACGVGDLFIATGTEENGFITDNLEWVYVPSANDTAFTFGTEGSSTEIKGSGYLGDTPGLKTIYTDTSNNPVSKDINISEEKGYVTATVGYKHNGITTVKNTDDDVIGANNTIALVSALSSDNYGHINNYTLKKIKIEHPVTQVALSTPNTVSNATSATITMGVEQPGVSETANFNFSSDTLTFTTKQAGKELNVNLQWGSF